MDQETRDTCIGLGMGVILGIMFYAFALLLML